MYTPSYQESISASVRDAIYECTTADERQAWGLGEVFAQDFNGIPGTVVVLNGTNYQGQVFMLYDQGLDMFSVMAYDYFHPNQVRRLSHARVTIGTALRLIKDLAEGEI